MIHQTFIVWRSLSPNHSSLRLLLLCLLHPDLFVIYYYCLLIFFKKLISFIGSLDKCHISIFNALISHLISSTFSYAPMNPVNFLEGLYNDARTYIPSSFKTYQDFDDYVQRMSGWAREVLLPTNKPLYFV